MTAKDLFAKDKLAHMAIGFLVCLLLQPVNPDLGMFTCVVLAWAKERYDFLRPMKHTPDGWDAYATVLGGAIFQASLLLWPLLACWFMNCNSQK